MSHISRIKSWFMEHKTISFLVVLLLFILFPIVVKDEFYRGVGVRTLLYVLFSTALNITNGYSGQFNIGFSGFMCVGCYSAAILLTSTSLGFVPTMLISGCITGFIGLLVALPTTRLSGMYLSLVTLGFAEIIRIIVLNMRGLTGGALGIKNIPNPNIFGLEIKGTFSLYYLILVLAILVIICAYLIINSRIGRAWIAIRENQDAAASLGINLTMYKALNFAISAFFAGIGGTFMASYYRFINTEMFMIDSGHEVLVMVVLGGMGTLVGPVIGAVSISVLLEMFRFASDYRMLIYAVVIIAVMWWRPQGIAGDSNSILATRRLSRHSLRRKQASRSKGARP